MTRRNCTRVISYWMMNFEQLQKQFLDRTDWYLQADISPWCPFLHSIATFNPFWPFLVILSRIDALFGAPFTGRNSEVVPQNWQISGMLTSMLDSDCKDLMRAASQPSESHFLPQNHRGINFIFSLQCYAFKNTWYFLTLSSKSSGNLVSN